MRIAGPVATDAAARASHQSGRASLEAVHGVILATGSWAVNRTEARRAPLTSAIGRERISAVFRLLPREEKFFDLFEQQASHIVAAAHVLEEMTLDYSDAKAKAQRTKDLEHAGDTLTHEIVRRLNTTFITPIDREDIYALASRLDDV